MYKFQTISTPEILQNGNVFADNVNKGFFTDMLHHMAELNITDSQDDFYSTSRGEYHGPREDMSTESGVAMSDDTSLLVEARPSSIDINKQKEVTDILIKYLQVIVLI